MIIKSIHIKNFRSIKNETLSFSNLTALVGANGSGKSSFLKAIEIFQNTSPKISEDDYYNKNTTEDIIIIITFSNLSEMAKKLFAKYVKNDELIVERTLTWNNGKVDSKFYGFLLHNPDFREIMNKPAPEAKKIYEELRQNEEYEELPKRSTYKEIKSVLEDWEAQNPHKCEKTKDDGQFFGFKEVAQGYLGKFVKFLIVPAIYDASDDAQEGKGSALTELMDRVIRTNLEENNEFKQIQKDIQNKYAEIRSISNLNEELEKLENKLTETLKRFVPDASIDLMWDLNEPKIELPAVARLVEDGYKAEVPNTGHGLQRAFIMTMLQHSRVHSGKTKDTTPIFDESPTLIFVIEEPELYQHPSRQRHIAEIFFSLVEGEISNVSEKTQIIYSTHSPHFVGIHRVEHIRLLRKEVFDEGTPKTTKIFSTNFDEISNKLSQPQRKVTVERLKSNLQTIMTPQMNEGFFSDVVVLVEGEEDRAYIMGTAQAHGYNFDGRGISVIQCGSKESIGKPAAIFKELGIPVYVMCDGDKGNETSEKETKYIASLLNQNIENGTFITDTLTCFETKIRNVVESEIGTDAFQKYFCEAKKSIGQNIKHPEKNPMIISMILKLAKQNNKSPKTLDNVINKILNLKNKSINKTL